MGTKIIITPGERYGSWTIVSSAPPRGRIKRCVVVCDCGTVRQKDFTALRHGQSGSCGCKIAEKATKHGMYKKVPEYSVWISIINRTSNERNKDFKYYGGRGITVCESWRNSFQAFYGDMGSRPSSKHSIDRIDNNRGYEPGNCRWATRSEQSQNTRKTKKVVVEGEEICIAEACRRFKVHRRTVRARIAKGMSVQEALTTPVISKRKVVQNVESSR